MSTGDLSSFDYYVFWLHMMDVTNQPSLVNFLAKRNTPAMHKKKAHLIDQHHTCADELSHGIPAAMFSRIVVYLQLLKLQHKVKFKTQER